MKIKVLNFLLIITSLFGYLEWGGNNHSFLFQAETELLSKILLTPASVIHPFTILPILGQLTLMIILFQKTPNKTMMYFGIASVGILLGFMFVIGCLSLKFKIILSTVPYIVLSILTLGYIRKKR